MNLSPYQEYKDSGVDWLGKVPVHWRIDRAKWSIRSCRNGIWGAEQAGNVNDIACVRVADFDRQVLRVGLRDSTIRNVVPKDRAGRILNKGDLLLEKSGGGDNQPVGCVVLYDGRSPAVCTNFIAKIELAPRMDASYWRYVHAAMYAVRLNTKSIKQSTGIQNLDDQQYFNEVVGYPSFEEQRSIATYLDRETAKIDDLVAEQLRLIELLDEKRRALINHAVTKGLNPDAKKKPSGVESLGEIPAHWCLSRIRFLAELNPPRQELSDVDTETIVSFFPMENIGEDGALTLDQAKPIRDCLNGYTYFREGDITIAKITPCFENGKGALMLGLTNGLGFGTTELIVVRAQEEKASPKYLHYLFSSSSFRSPAEASMYGAGGQKRVPDLYVKNFCAAVPPKDEQNSIASFLDRETARIYDLVDEQHRLIELLNERRAALITAAVSGKIDLRNVEAA